MDPPLFLKPSDVLFLLPEGNCLIDGPFAEKDQNPRRFVSKQDVISFVIFRALKSEYHTNANYARVHKQNNEHNWDRQDNEIAVERAIESFENSTGRSTATPRELLLAWAESIGVLFDAADALGHGTIPWHVFVAHIMGLINSHGAEENRRLMSEFSLETRGGIVDDEETSNIIKAQLRGEGNRTRTEEKYTISDSVGPPISLSDRTTVDSISSMSVEYINDFSVWSVLVVYSSKAGQLFRNTCWFILEESGLEVSISIRHVFEDHGVCICHYIQPLKEFVVISRRQTIATFAYHKSFAPASITGLRQRHGIEPRRRSSHLPFDVATVRFCTSTGILLMGTLDGCIIGLPVLSSSDSSWHVPLFIIRKCADDTVTSLVPLPKSRRIICGSFSPQIKLADTDKMTVRQGITLPSRFGGIRHILIIEHLHIMLTCGHGSEIALWALSFPSDISSEEPKKCISRSLFLGELKDADAPHVPPLIAIWRGGEDLSQQAKMRNKIFSVDAAGTVKIWDIPSRQCVSTCPQPSYFRTFAAGCASRQHADTLSRKIPTVNRERLGSNTSVGKLWRSNLAQYDEHTADEAIKIRLCGVDVSNHRVETREVLIYLNDDFQETSQKEMGILESQMPPASKNTSSRPAMSETMKRGKHLVHSGHSLRVRALGGRMAKPYHIGTFDVEGIGCIVSITNNFIVVLERVSFRVLSRFSDFEAPFTAASVSSSKQVWRFSRIAFVALEGTSVINGVNLGNGETSLKLQMYQAARHGTQCSRRDIVSIISVSQRNIIIAANGEGCIGVFKLPPEDSRIPTTPIRPTHFVQCTKNFITRMAYHDSAEILAVGDGQGRLYQWEVSQSTFALCSRIIQHSSVGENQPSRENTCISSNEETDAQLHAIALDETSLEITAIASLDPLRAFVVATSDAKVAIWTTVPFDKAISLFSWNYFIPGRHLTAAHGMHPVVTSINVGKSKRTFLIRVVDDHGAWSTWGLDSALKDSRLFDSISTDAQDATAKWSTKELFGNVRPPTIVKSRQLTSSYDLPLVSIQDDPSGRGKFHSLVSVSNGDGLLLDADGVIREVIHPTTRNALSSSTDALPQTAHIALYCKDAFVHRDCATNKAVQIANSNNSGSPVQSLHNFAEHPVEPRLPQPTRDPPPSRTDYIPVRPKMRVSGLRLLTTRADLRTPDCSPIAMDSNIFDRPLLKMRLFWDKVKEIELQSETERLKGVQPPLLFSANIALALASPMAFTYHGIGTASDDDATISRIFSMSPSHADCHETHHIRLALGSARAISIEKPELLSGGNFVLYNCTEPLPGAIHINEGTLECASDFPTCHENNSKELAPRASEGGPCDKILFENRFVSEDTPEKPQAVAAMSVGRDISASLYARLSDMICSSSVAYPLTASPYLSGKPPSLMPSEFGFVTRIKTNGGTQPHTASYQTETRQASRVVKGSICRVSSPVTRNSSRVPPTISLQSVSPSREGKEVTCFRKIFTKTRAASAPHSDVRRMDINRHLANSKLTPIDPDLLRQKNSNIFK